MNYRADMYPVVGKVEGQGPHRPVGFIHIHKQNKKQSFNSFQTWKLHCLPGLTAPWHWNYKRRPTNTWWTSVTSEYHHIIYTQNNDNCNNKAQICKYYEFPEHCTVVLLMKLMLKCLDNPAWGFSSLVPLPQWNRVTGSLWTPAD